MPRTRANLVCAMIACAVAPNHLGCISPWMPPAAKAQSLNHPAAAVESAKQAAPKPSPAPPHNSGPDLAGVLDKLQQVRAIDPAAEQKLVDELRNTPPDSWPLVAEQFRASLAYREQLIANEIRSGQSLISNKADGRPSMPIGALTDPRHAETDELSARPQTMHHAMQAPLIEPDPPAEFAVDGPAYPIVAQSTLSANDARAKVYSPVQQAAFESMPTAEPIDDLAKPLRPSASHESPSADADWQQLVQKAVADLEQRVAESPTTTAEVHQHASLRMLRLLAGDTERALEPIPHISPGAQDFWSRQIFALATYLDHHSQPDDNRRAAASVTHLDEAVSHLRELGSLSLRNLAFCKNVFGYGAIEPYKEDRFAPGEEVSLYVEIENYHSQSTDKGFCTILASSYELLNDKGERVAGGDFPDVEDCCRTRRRDFHIQYGLALPSKLTPGEYKLQLVVKDRQSDKIGHAIAAFGVRDKPAAQ